MFMALTWVLEEVVPAGLADGLHGRTVRWRKRTQKGFWVWGPKNR